jgi:hypothetical protein
MGSSKKQTIGHKYGVGMHMVLCRQMDALLSIKLATKDAWHGYIASGRGTVKKPELFGGDKREGGFDGQFDVLSGDQAQPVNDYLASVLGTLTSAYRGAVSLVWRRPYIGANSARLPAMEFKLINVAGVHRGWLPEKAVIGAEGYTNGASIYIAIDASGSMTLAMMETQGAAIADFIRSMVGTTNSVKIVAYNGTIEASMARYDCEDADYEALASWVENYTERSAGTDWTVAVSEAAAFYSADNTLERRIYDGNLFSSVSYASWFSTLGASRDEGRRKVLVLTTDGEPTPATVAPAIAAIDAIGGVEVFAFNINSSDTTYAEMIDNTPADGVPVVDGGDAGEISAALANTILSWADMNPAHIIRCLWTDPMRGGSAEESEIGDSFAEAADLFVTEKFGLSPQFNGSGSVESDRLDVERHVDAVSYRSRRTGKIELKAIRNDYSVEDLQVLDSSIVLEWSGLEKALRSEVPNQLTVVYTKRENGETASVTRTNVAGVRRAGRVIPGDPVEYLSITTADLATRVCLRDLSVQDRPLLAGQITLAYLPPDLEIGEPFIINEPILGINNVVVRIIESQEGDGRDNSVVVRISEDRHALPVSATTGTATLPPAVVIPRAEPSPYRIVEEAPYYLMVLDQTQAEVDDALATEPDLGVLLATGTRTTPAHRDMTVAVDAGGGYQDESEAQFVTSLLTLSALTSEADDVVITVAADDALDGVTANSLALVGTELMRVDAMAENLLDPANVDVTFGRGCLDTVPIAHAIGSRIVFLQNADPRETQYLAAETIDVKLLTNLIENTLTLAAAPVDSVTFDSRAIRPYPPGRFKLNGSYAQDQFTADVVLTWVGRDRTLQTTPVPEDHDDLGIGPEVGTTYRVRVEALDASLAIISTVTDTNVGSAVTYDWDDATVLPSGTDRIRFRVTSVRGGYESWQSPNLTTMILLPPGDLTAEAY